jgi:apolipoprotein N-acyltransferase
MFALNLYQPKPKRRFKMETIVLDGTTERVKTENRTKQILISLAMLLAGSLLVGFSAGRWLAPLAAWFGPVLIMRYARDHKVGRGYLLVLAASILATIIGFLSIWLGGMPRPLVPFLTVGIGFLWSLPYLVDRVLSSRLPGFVSTFAYPLAATSLELLFIHFNPLGTWGATGFTQYGVLPLMQLASVTGMIGITFLMGWFAGVANWAWENREQRSVVVKGSIVYGAVLAAVFVFGFLRLNLAPTSKTDDTIRVAGITSASISEIFDIRTVDPQPYWEAYFKETVREAQAGAQVIIWPEVAGFGSFSEESFMITRAQEIARQNEIYLALPLLTFDPNMAKPVENKLLLIDPTGSIVMEHVKYGGAITEGYRLVGNGELHTVITPFGVLSGVICYDLDYPAVVRQVGQNGTGLLLVPSKDWFEIDPVHTHMAVFRAIENGTSLVRQTDAGLSMAVDPYGRVLAQSDFFGTTDRTMVAQVPVKHVPTIYTSFGRWFEWLCVAGFLFVVVWAVIPRRQEQ